MKLLKPKNLSYEGCPTGLIDHCAYVVHQILFFKRIYKNEYVYLPSSSLVKMLGTRQYGPAMSYLKKNKIIKNDGSYKKGKKCYHYELCEPYASAKMAPHELDPRGKISKKIEKLRGASTLSRKAAYSCKVKRGPDTRSRYQHVLGSLDVLELNCEDYHTLAKCFDHTLSPTGRLYYPFALQPSSIRSQALLGGEKTQEVDIACCQPYLLATLYPANSTEKEKYILLIQKGDFYIDIFGEDESRDEVKKKAYRSILFGAAKYMNGSYGKKLKEKLPELWQIIFDLKEANPNGKGEEKTGNSYFACLLQKKESQIIFSVVEKLRQLNIPCLTIHDSIRVGSSSIGLTTQYLWNECFETTGIEPQLKVS
ncbi:hypothetical protein [Puniceicoccus vermicola]|uniref:Uncharacterized protein n=1 Tax=Puniceicoccus vermicola TaxID=388746 RepID=A0A7X1AXZ9_9BACT|nr:hypothetical protein [Puniceicoccus vermicola]MBC2602066.1 hypothetical protein [Puniceicoccus vermicola]